MQNNVDRFCPLCKKEIESEVCYEIIMCFSAGFDTSSIPEVDILKNESNRNICDNCHYSDIA